MRARVWTVGICAGVLLSALWCSPTLLAAQKSMGNIKELIEQSRQAMADGDMAKAVHRYRLVVESEPTQERWIMLAQLEHAVGATRREEKAWLQVIEIDKSYWPAYVALGRIYLAKGNLASAVDYFQRCAHQASPDDPSYAGAMNGLDQVMAKSSYYKEKIISARAAKVQAAIDIENTQRHRDDLERQMQVYKALLSEGKSSLASKNYQHALNTFDTALHFVPGDDEAARLREAALMGLEQQRRTSMTESAINTILSSRSP